MKPQSTMQKEITVHKAVDPRSAKIRIHSTRGVDEVGQSSDYLIEVPNKEGRDKSGVGYTGFTVAFHSDMPKDLEMRGDPNGLTEASWIAILIDRYETIVNKTPQILAVLQKLQEILVLLSPVQTGGVSTAAPAEGSKSV